MKTYWILLVLVLASLGVFAQQPLSKRDQEKKAAFLAQIEAEKKYEELMGIADAAFKQRDYVKARMTYNDAIQYNEEKEQWLTSKVNDLDILMAKIIMREIDSITVLRSERDIALPKKEMAEHAIAQRDEEMKIIPTDPVQEVPDEPEAPEAPEVISDEPEEELVEELVEEEAPIIPEVTQEKPKPEPKPQTNPEPKVTVVNPPAVKEEVKVKEDYSAYPQGRSEETFTFPDHTVRRIVVKDGIDTITYKYVTHRWGGKFYFKDDISISERIWKEEVAEFEKKYPENSKAAE